MLPRAHIRLILRVIACSAILLANVPAQAGLIIDDFTDPAEIRLPEGPSSVVTDGVGDLNATRSVSFRLGMLEPEQIAKANIASSAPGQFLVDIDEPRTRMYVDTEYTFAPTDLTQGSVNDAFFVEFTFAEGMVTTLPQTEFLFQPPSVMLLAQTAARPTLLIAAFSAPSTRPFPNHEAPYTLIAPFDRFTDPDGGQVNRDFSDILSFELWLFAHGGFGPWEVHIDSIRVGSMSAIPEPSGVAIAGTLLICVLAVRVASLFFNRWN